MDPYLPDCRADQRIRVTESLHAVRAGIFRTDLKLSAFSRLFFIDHPEIIANRNDRWRAFLKAANNGRMMQRPDVPPLWHPYKIYRPALIGRLQSSYEDVEYEMSEMTKEQAEYIEVHKKTRTKRETDTKAHAYLFPLCLYKPPLSGCGGTIDLPWG